jgi:hypothetical protein
MLRKLLQALLEAERRLFAVPLSLYPAPPRKPSPPDGTVPKYSTVCVDGFWFLAVYRLGCDMWSEDFMGPQWAWWQINKTFQTEEDANQYGKQLVAKAIEEAAAERATKVFQDSLLTSSRDAPGGAPPAPLEAP